MISSNGEETITFTFKFLPPTISNSPPIPAGFSKTSL
jgi:hypothetical protein